MATMKDVARRANVSIATVSAVLSGKSFVSVELRARVEAAIAELGYARNAMARSLKMGHSSLIGLVVPDITNPFFTDFLDIVQRQATAAGYSLLFALNGDGAGNDVSALALMRSHQVAGTIMCPTGDTRAYTRIGHSAGQMKLVLADNAPDGTDVDTIALDNVRAAHMAAQHIAALGHRRIAVISGPEIQFVAQARHIAFLTELARLTGGAVDVQMARGEFRAANAQAAAYKIFAAAERPTAVFVGNNLMLIGVMRALSELGLSVPQDVSVISIDDFPWASSFQPALSVIRQPIQQMAESALQCLLTRIKGDSGPPQRHEFPPELVLRKSTLSISS